MQTKRKANRRRSSFLSRRGRLVGQPLDRRLRIEPLEDRRLLAVVTVDNALDVTNGDTSSITSLIANDGGDGIALREALVAANATAGVDTITFGLSGQVIAPGSALPLITDSVVIDATTAPGYVGEPLITLDGLGAGAAAGLYVLASAPNSEIHGFSIIRFTDGIVLESNDNLVSQNYVGISPSGGTGVGNAFDGMILDNVSGNLITENVISGNFRHGVVIDGSGSNVVTSNRIGTDIVGLTAVGNAGDGVQIFNSSNNQIGGVVDTDRNIISGNQQGVTIIGSTAPASNNAIQGNYIGTDVTGLQEIPNLDDGIQLWNVTGASNGAVTGNLIGGDDDDDGSLDGIVRARNIISGNTNEGVALFGSEVTQNHIEGNWIGLTADGQATLPNSIGVNITNPAGEPPSQAAFSNTIGGISAGAGNVISGNSRDGIQFGFGTFSNLVLGNFIGTDISGGADSNAPLNLGNSRYGILISDATDNLVGGVTAAERNVIAGNLSHGVVIKPGGFDLPTVRNQILGNYIGVLIDGVTEHGNGGSGVFIEEASDNIIGGTSVEAGNVIAFNGGLLGKQGHGVVVESGVLNQIRKNSIYDNHGRGIDLGNDSFTINDRGDGDSGANSLQNFPVVTHVGFFGPLKTITWSLTGEPESTYEFDFFANDVPDPSGFGEGKTYLSSATVTTDLNGLVDQTVFFNASDQFISATATDGDGNTSEFSMVDTDGDALADAWETMGININEDDTIDLTLGSNPNHKDIFVEVDAMVGRVPDPGTLLDVVNAFSAVPDVLVQNQDTMPGITLHAALDETNIPLSAFPNKWVEANVVKLARFGTVAERADVNAANILAAKRLTHRWSIFADTHSGGDSSGSSKLPGNDFFVSLGLWLTPGGTPGGTREQQASTFMHELGHTLGLRHGGKDHDLYKPNYHSVMNYTWQTPADLPASRPPTANELAFRASWTLDYSRSAFPDLNEASLNEPEGIGGHAGHTVLINGTNSFVTESGAVDWNRTGGSAQTGVMVDLDGDGNMKILSSYADWSNLQYYFVETSAFASGAPVSNPNDELTFELWQSMVDWRALPGDYNLSGTVGAADLTVWQDTFGQAAITPFANADGSGNSLVDGADFLVWQRNFGKTTNTDEPIVVTNNNDSGDGSLRHAIQRANLRPGDDTITFDTTVFATPQTILLESGEFDISESVTIDALALAGVVTIDAQQNSRIFDITATTGDFTLAGLTLTGGRTLVDNTLGRGGAIRSLTNGILTIAHSTVSGNSTAGLDADGGGISSNGAVTLTSSTVSGNNTAGNYADGGGIYSNGAVTLTSSTVSGNSTAGFAAYGGGIYSTEDVTLTSSTVSGNSTAGYGAYGGGIRSAEDVTLTSSTVSGNGTTGTRAHGGGIHSFGDALTLTNSTVSGNTTTGNGADGGGIRVEFGAVTLTSSTVSGNSTAGENADGGGIKSFDPITLIQSTVTDNHAYHATSTGGGIWNHDPLIRITGSILAGNTAGGGMADFDPGTGTLDVNFSLIQQTGLTITGGDNIIGQSANLGPLANNGGPTETHALLPGSPAIDMGDPSIVFSPIEFDQRGAPFVRVFDDPVATGSGIDMGAFEVQPIVASADFDSEGDVDGDFLVWQRGIGTSPASKSDGDADNDTDVDGDDLGVWGTVPPLAAIESLGLSDESQRPENGSLLLAVSSQTMLNSELLDLALAVEWMGQPAVGDDLFIEVQHFNGEAARDFVLALKDISPVSRVAMDNELQTAGSDEEDSGEENWLSDELLEGVFG